ncbi:helix-turn-helix transcriptional regulator [Halomonas sp. BC04]|uniref:helix-turn-helix transcriptional regulator n=1 Tax=Halomonas sp. BC04 TaxID=1403540 RepID=UPI0004B41852|nr:helix-turn-helix transcriptional regulator [Halomonas sp. BC04]
MTKAKTEAAAGRKIPEYSDPSYWHGTIKMSLSKFFVLSVLHRKPMHGYEVVQAVEKSTKAAAALRKGRSIRCSTNSRRGAT